MENDTEFSKASGRKLLKNQTDKRVSDDAAVKLNRMLQDRGAEVAEAAKRYAEHDGRKTVRSGDVRKAVRELD